MKKVRIIFLVAGIAIVTTSLLSFKIQREFTGTLVCYTKCQAGAKFLGKIYTFTESGFPACCTIPGQNVVYMLTTVTLSQ